LDRLNRDHRPKDLQQAYKIQRAATDLWKDEVVGWKVGATALEIQRLFGIDHCLCGPVFGHTVFTGPARLEAAHFHHLMLESEFAFRFAKSLPPREEIYTRSEILKAIDALLPAFEIVSPRFPRLTVDDIPQLVADFCANGGAVVGSPRRDWINRDLSLHKVRLFIDGSLVQSGTGASVLGDPLNALEWLVNELRANNRGIEPGQLVFAGTVTGIHTPTIGQTAVADFGELGTVEVVFH
jgi:2-keto-4-pentenoate hydratase